MLCHPHDSSCVMHQLLDEYFLFCPGTSKELHVAQQHICGCIEQQGVGTSIISWLRSPDWNPFLLWPRCAELCFASHHRKSIHLLLHRHRQGFTLVWGMMRLYYPSEVCPQAVQVGSLPAGFDNDSVWESRNLPCHRDKDRNGVRLVPLKLRLSWEMPASGLSPCHPLPRLPWIGQWSSVLELRRGDVNKLKCRRFTRADILGEPHTLTLDSL